MLRGNKINTNQQLQVLEFEVLWGHFFHQIFLNILRKLVIKWVNNFSTFIFFIFDDFYKASLLFIDY